MLVNVEKLNFGYNDQLQILKDVSFSIDKGEIVGILGSNGSGKTTLINLLIGYLKSSCKLSVLNKKPDINDISFKSSIGIVRDDDQIIDFLTLYEYLYFVGRSYNIEKNVLEKRIDELSN